MKTGFVLQCTLLVILLLATSSDGFFFEYPKKALMDFIQSLKDKKEAKKKPQGNNSNVRHYHVHYYPAPIHVISEPPTKAPTKNGLDEIYRKSLASLGWSNYEYKLTPEPRITITSGLQSLWNDVQSPVLWDQNAISSQPSDIIDSRDRKGIIVQVPLHQQIVIHQPSSTPPTKTNFLAAFIEKITGSKNLV